MKTFLPVIESWVDRVEGALPAIRNMAALRLAEHIQDLLERMVYDGPPAPSGYIRTGFLRASFVASTTSMPAASLRNPGGSFTVDAGQIEMVIAGAEPDEVIYLGYTAAYGPYVHYGANGQPPRQWMAIAATAWPEIVDRCVKELKQRLKL